jgi:hypothetical protein
LLGRRRRPGGLAVEHDLYHLGTPSPSNAPRTWSGDALQGLPELIAGLPDDALICLLDAYVHAFLSPRSLRASHV